MNLLWVKSQILSKCNDLFPELFNDKAICHEADNGSQPAMQGTSRPMTSQEPPDWVNREKVKGEGSP